VCHEHLTGYLTLGTFGMHGTPAQSRGHQTLATLQTTKLAAWTRECGRGQPSLAPIGAWLLAISVYYAFITSAGTFELVSWHTDYYDLLVQGWREGHLYLPITPKPRLLTRANPYNYRYVRDWLWDASLYNRHYYLYWGPAPGLCLWFFKTITGYADKVHDQWLVLWFMLIRLYAGAALIIAYARAQAPQLPSWALQLAILVFGLASPTLYFMARPLIYEASISAGQAFVFLGLLLAYFGAQRPRARTRCFVLAGICFAFALSSRGSLIVVTPLLVVVTAIAANREAGYPRRSIARDLLALGLPVAVAIALNLIYNKLRFDSFSEFGLKYQLTSPPFKSEGRFVLPNIVSYLTSAVAWSCKFPFARLPVKRHLTTWITWPEDYDPGDWSKGERTAGILFATSVCWLWLMWLWRWRTTGQRLRSLPNPSQRVLMSWRELWLLGCSLALLCGLAPASRMWMANARFLEDASGGILLGAIGGGFWLLTRVQRTQLWIPRALGTGLFAALGLHSIVVGLLLGFTGHMNNFGEQNPELFKQLVAEFSMCRR